MGFGQHQVLDLVGWRGARRDPRFLDVVAAARAVIARGPRPKPLASIPRTRRRLAPPVFLAAAVALVAAGAGNMVAAWGFNLRLGSSPPPNSIAVLPFANLSGDPAQDYFSDGLSEELIGTLARLKPLHVIARSSSFHFKGSQDDGATIGMKLGVRPICSTAVSVGRAKQVRVSAELADARTGYERWNATYDRDLKDIFAVQSGIAQSVADALKVQLFGGDIAALSLNGTTSPEAYDSYLRGRHLLDQGAGEADYRQALARFNAAIAADPRYASAYAARATALVYLANQFVGPDRLRATYDEALSSARQGVELGSRPRRDANDSGGHPGLRKPRFRGGEAGLRPGEGGGRRGRRRASGIRAVHLRAW